MTLSFAHIINPFAAKPGTEHDRAQRVTFESMRRALDYVHQHPDVAAEVLAVTFPADAPVIPSFLKAVPKLSRSVLDFAGFKQPRQFPLLADILNLGYEHSTADFLIFTNVDIAVQPHFYHAVRDLFAAAPAPFACAINRRSLPDSFHGPEEIEAMYAHHGETHPGFDCFVFPRAFVPKLRLGHVCVGSTHLDYLLLANLDLLADFRFQILRDLHLTFHLGNDATWLTRLDYDEFNLQESLVQFKAMLAGCPDPQHDFKFVAEGYVREHRRLSTKIHRRLRRIQWLHKLVRTLRHRKPAAGAA